MVGGLFATASKVAAALRVVCQSRQIYWKSGYCFWNQPHPRPSSDYLDDQTTTRRKHLHHSSYLSAFFPRRLGCAFFLRCCLCCACGSFPLSSDCALPPIPGLGNLLSAYFLLHPGISRYGVSVNLTVSFDWMFGCLRAALEDLWLEELGRLSLSHQGR